MLAFFSRLRGIFSFNVVFVAAFFLTGCVAPDSTSVNRGASTPASNSEPQAGDVSPTPEITKQQEANMPVTLPLLDAMLADEAFASEAQTSLKLTDQEIQKLRDVARNAVLMLTSDPADDQTRSTLAARDEARKQVGQVLGEERTARFFALIQQRWAADGEELATAKPNAVPTDTRIVVNAPAYRMDIFDDGKLIKSYKIGIGYPEFPLPTGLRKARAIIFNPTWTPPDEPWVKGKVRPGKKVEAGSDLNPLGPIKIPIGSPSLIHGGKSPARLGTFASHGCVGLTNAQVQDFALKISNLSARPLSLTDIKGYEKAKTETKEVKLNEPIPVELRYETIVVENGRLRIYRDVYEKGTNTEENLRRVLDSVGVSLDSLEPAVRDKILAGLAQMATDPAGKAIEHLNGANSNKNAGVSEKKAGPASKNGRVTRNIKGKKEIAFQLPELTGKGYPAAVGLRM